MKSFFVFFFLAVSAPLFAACSSTNVAHDTADAGCAGLPLDCGDSTKCPWPSPVCIAGKWECEAATILCDVDAGKTNDAAVSDGGCSGTPVDCGDSTKCPWPSSVCINGTWGCEAATIECNPDAGDAAAHD